jgi:hypothetical protein
MAVVFVAVYRNRLSAGPFVGLLLSGPLFILVGAVLAKFGYTRKTLRDLRAETAARREASSTTTPAATTGTRHKPPPTRRTSTGPGRTRGGTKPRRR